MDRSLCARLLAGGCLALALAGLTFPAAHAEVSPDLYVPYTTPGVAVYANAEADNSSTSRMESRNVAATREAARVGATGYAFTARRSPSYAYWGGALIPPGSYFSLRMWVRVVSVAPTENLTLLSVKNVAEADQLDVFTTPGNQRLMWDLNTADKKAGPILKPGQWYLLEAFGGFTANSYTTTVLVDGKNLGTVTSKGGKLTPVKSIWLGSMDNRTHTVNYDDVVFAVSPTPLAALPVVTNTTASASGTLTATPPPQAAPPATPGQSSGVSDRILVLIGALAMGLLVVAWLALREHRRRRASEVQRFQP